MLGLLYCILMCVGVCVCVRKYTERERERARARAASGINKSEFSWCNNK